MIRRSLICALIFGVISVVVFPVVASSASQSSNQQTRSAPLTEEKIQWLKEQAIDGSGDAAKQLAVAYLVYGSHKDEAQYWSTIGAENGNAVCMYNLWTLLREKGDKLSLARSLFWLRRAATLGDLGAIKQLEKMRLYPDKKGGN